MLARTACARHQPIPLEHAKQGALPPPPLYRATGTDKSPARNSPRAKPHPPPQRAVGTYKAPAGNRPRANAHTSKRQTTASATTCGQPMQGKQSHDRHQSWRVSNQDAANSHGSSQSGSDRTAPGCKHDARPSYSDRCKHDSKSPPPAPNSRDARISSAVSRRTIHTPGFPSSERPHAAPMASTMEWVPPWSQAWRPPATYSSTESG